MPHFLLGEKEYNITGVRRWWLTSSKTVRPKDSWLTGSTLQLSATLCPLDVTTLPITLTPSFFTTGVFFEGAKHYFLWSWHLGTTSVWPAHPWRPKPGGGGCTFVLHMTESNARSSSATQQCKIQYLKQSWSQEHLPNPAHIVPVFLCSNNPRINEKRGLLCLSSGRAGSSPACSRGQEGPGRTQE